MFMEFEWRMVNPDTGLSMNAKTSNLTEELGQVEYIFSDKTGTLTQNVMYFKKIIAGAKSYAADKSNKTDGEISHAELVQFMEAREEEHFKPISRVMKHLSLCHSIIIDPSDGKYSASSPDELALVDGAKELGFEFRGRQHGENQELITVVYDPKTKSE